MPLTTRSLRRVIYPETRQLLERIYRHSRHHETRRRAHCLMLKHQGLSTTELMSVFQVSRKTIYQWFNAWDTEVFQACTDVQGKGVSRPLPSSKNRKSGHGHKPIR